MAIKFYGQYLVADTEAELLNQTPTAGQIGFPMDSKIRLLYDGSSWQVNSVIKVLRGPQINALTTGNTIIATIPSSTVYRFVVLGLHVEYVNISGSIGLAPTITVGTNSPNFNNIGTASSLLTTLSAQGTTQTSAFTIGTNIAALTAGTTVTARVSTAATLFSAYTVRMDVFGYWEN